MVDFVFDFNNVWLFKNWIVSCKDQLWLKPGTGMDPGPRNPNNKFIESGRKC